MSLDAFGGVLVNSPGELSVQPLLSPQSSFLTQTAFIQGPPTEITLDEDDVFQCGKCKKVFTSFQLFMFHKKEHQLTSSGSKFFGVGMALTLDGELGGDLERNLSSVGLTDQGVCLGDSVVQNQCCRELPLQDLDSSSQQNSTDVLEYAALGESTFDELHSDMSQPMMLGDSDSISFSMEQNSLSISNSDQLPESGFVPSSMSDIQSTILPDKLIQHEDCETSCDTVWHLSQKDDSSSLNFNSSGFGEEQPLFLDEKKFNVRSDEKLTESIEYSNDGLLREVSYSSDKEVFINESSSIGVQEVMAESESQILPSGEFFSKNSMDYMSNNDILTEFEKVGQATLVDGQISEPVTILEVEMPLLSSDQLQTPLMDAAVLPALIPIQEQVMQEQCNSLKGRVVMEHMSPIVIQEPGIAQGSIISPQNTVTSEGMLLQQESITKQVMSILRANGIKRSKRELKKSLSKPSQKERKERIIRKKEMPVRMLKYSAKSFGNVCETLESTASILHALPDDQQMFREQAECSEGEPENHSDEEITLQKLKQTENAVKKSKGMKNLKYHKPMKASSMLPSSPIFGLSATGPISPVALLESTQSSQCDSGGKKKPVRESSWEPRALKLTCEFCSKKFAKQFDLQQHLRSHTGEKPFQCIVCGRAFAQKSNVTKHIRTHKVWPKGVLTLPQNFLRKVDLNKKVSLGIDYKMLKGDGKDNVQQADSEAALNNSMDTELSESVSPNMSAKKKDLCRVESEEYIIDNSYLCQFCHASFLTYFELKTHLKVHQDEKVYFCSQKGCKQTFQDLVSFVDHVQMHDSQEATYRCHVCKETFRSLEDLGTHQYTHTTSKRAQPASKRSAIKCTECKSRFLSPEALEQHMITATHEHPCPECERVFPCERNLRRHLTTHSTVCPYVCKECGKCFKTEAYLNVHLTMHSEDKPYACTQCPSKFARKDRLSRHLLIHEESKRIKCPFHIHFQCTRDFTRKDKLKAHVLTHTEHEHLDCKICKREILNYSGKKKYQRLSQTISDGECEQSLSEEGKEYSKDSSATDQDCGGSPSSMESVVAVENYDGFSEVKAVEICHDDSACYLSSGNLPTVEIIVMPLRLSIR